MNTSVGRVTSSRLSGLTPLGRLAAWFNAKWEARRARLAEEDAVEFLRAMEPKLLDDIGVDIIKLGKPPAKVEDQNPHVIATLVLTPSRHQDPL